MTQCLWGLLATRNLEFIHVSGYTHKLKGHSLYQLIHQDELHLARRDITKFISTQTFGGSITKCRIRDFMGGSQWFIMDVVLYIASKDTLLCFLHQQDTHGECNTVHEEEAMLNIRENLLQREQSSSPSLSTSSSLSSNTSELEYSFPYQCFHIVNNRHPSVLLTWPDYYPNESTQDILDYSHLPQRTSCFLCVQPPTRFTSLGQKIQTLKINYGSLTFILISIENPIKRPLELKKHAYSMELANNKQYHPKHHCQSCGTDTSPEWRRGPTGHKTLCNACGLRYSRSVVRQEKLAKQKQFALFQSQNTPHGYLPATLVYSIQDTHPHYSH